MEKNRCASSLAEDDAVDFLTISRTVSFVLPKV